MFEKLDERLNMLSRSIIHRKKHQLLEIKITVSVVQNILDGINGRPDITEENIS